MLKRLYELGQFVTTNYPFLEFTSVKRNSQNLCMIENKIPFICAYNKISMFDIFIWPILEHPVKLYFAGVQGFQGSESQPLLWRNFPGKFTTLSCNRAKHSSTSMIINIKIHTQKYSLLYSLQYKNNFLVGAKSSPSIQD